MIIRDFAYPESSPLFHGQPEEPKRRASQVSLSSSEFTGRHARALYDFSPETEYEVSMKAGDIVWVQYRQCPVGRDRPPYLLLVLGSCSSNLEIRAGWLRMFRTRLVWYPNPMSNLCDDISFLLSTICLKNISPNWGRFLSLFILSLSSISFMTWSLPHISSLSYYLFSPFFSYLSLFLFHTHTLSLSIPFPPTHTLSIPFISHEHAASYLKKYNIVFA